MASFTDELLSAAKVLLAREPRRRGRLPDAKVRRAISTSYYALFHFLVEEATRRIAGTHNSWSTRRRMLARSFSHKGIRNTFDKIRGQNVDLSLEDFFRGVAAPVGRVASPLFARNMARVFLDAHAKREDADYNRNESLSEADATILIARIEAAIRDWKIANALGDRDFKHAIYVMMMLKGLLRNDN